MLSLAHPWIFCAACLRAGVARADGDDGTLRSGGDTPVRDTPGGDRCGAEPTTGCELVGDRWASQSVSASTGHGVQNGDSACSGDSSLDGPSSSLPTLKIPPRPRGSDTTVDPSANPNANANAASALPTPPPSSHQSSPRWHAHDASSAPSSPEMPLASLASAFSTSASLSSPRAPRHAKRAEKHEHVWESDLSDLTPLSSSVPSDASDNDAFEDEHDGSGPAPADTHADASKEAAEGERGRGLTIRIGFPHTRSFVCVRKRCHNLLMPWSRWKMCHACRLRLRDRSRERHGEGALFERVAPVSSTSASASASSTSSAAASNSSTAESGAAPGVVQGAPTPTPARMCAIRRCPNALPPAALYKWKLCDACRTRTRRQSRKRRYGDVGLASDEDGEDAVSLARLAGAGAAGGFKKLRLTFRGEMVASVEARRRAARAAASVVSRVSRIPSHPWLCV